MRSLFWLTEKAEAPPTARVARANDSFMMREYDGYGMSEVWRKWQRHLPDVDGHREARMHERLSAAMTSLFFSVSFSHKI